MGTHPIFESDFDCLTDLKMWGGFGGFGQGWRGQNRGRGGFGGNMGRGGQMYPNRGGMRPQMYNQRMPGGMGMGMNPMGMGRGGMMGMNPMGQMGMQRPNMGNQGMQNQGGMNYAGAVKNEPEEKKVKQEPMNQNQSSQEPKKKKLRLEQMGFGNMGAGFGCSQFVANQGEEMPTMLQMGYAGEGPGVMGADEGTGFGDYADDVKTEFKGV